LLICQLLVSPSILTTSPQDRQLEEHFPSAWPGVLHLSREGGFPVIKLEVHSSLALKTYEEVSTQTGMGFVDPGRTLLTQEK